MQPVLQELLKPMSSSKFLREYLPDRPVVTHGPIARLLPMAQLAETISVESLLSLETTRIVSFYDGPDGSFRGVPSPPELARRLYFDATATICLSEVQRDRALSAIRTLSMDLAEEVGVSASTARVHIYASPDGSGLRAHWDASEAFIVQLRGAKRWRIARNEYVEWPTENYVPGGPTSAEVQAVLERGITPSMPVTESLEFVLQPGSVLFLPRGYWHETAADGESLSLALKFSVPTWGELLATVIGAQLRILPRWRQPAVGISGQGMVRDLACSKLLELLSTDSDGPLTFSVNDLRSLLAILTAGTC